MYAGTIKALPTINLSGGFGWIVLPRIHIFSWSLFQLVQIPAGFYVVNSENVYDYGDYRLSLSLSSFSSQ